jgi:hypothetical protein
MKKKTKEVKLPMNFNIGLQKYEPVLPSSRKKGKKIKFKDVWQLIWIILIMLALFVGAWLLVRKGLV